jgi:regulatory helix-turn-helix LysR family protein
MELRQLRHFVAVAEAGCPMVAPERKLHASEPSFTRQRRNLKDEVGVLLLTRGARSVERTPAGRTFFDHACCSHRMKLRRSSNRGLRAAPRRKGRWQKAVGRYGAPVKGKWLPLTGKSSAWGDVPLTGSLTSLITSYLSVGCRTTLAPEWHYGCS